MCEHERLILFLGGSKHITHNKSIYYNNTIIYTNA